MNASVITLPIESPIVDVEVQVDGQDLYSWSEILAQFDDASIYQSWAYGSVRWGAQNLSHLVMRVHGEAAAAAQVRIARLPLLSSGIAYVRWGPMCQRKNRAFTEPTLRKMFSELRREYSIARGLSLQVLPDAYAGTKRAEAFCRAFEDAGFRPQLNASSYRTVIVPLAASPEAQRTALAQKWRNQLNAAERNGIEVEISTSAAAYAEFSKLYAVMWDRKRFETSVDVNEFGRIQTALTDAEKMRIFLARKGGRPIAAVVCSLAGSTAIYVLGATNEEGRQLKAAYLLHWRAMRWLQEHGAARYDLGGIDPVTNPGGFHFKNGFGGQVMNQISRHIHPGNSLSRAIAFGVGVVRGENHRGQNGEEAGDRIAAVG